MASSWDCAWGPDPLAEDDAQCETCDKWPHGIGANRCECCTECGGDGWLYATPLNVSPAQSPISCDQCLGTGRAKAVT